jgi:hypothetical protein
VIADIIPDYLHSIYKSAVVCVYVYEFREDINVCFLGLAPLLPLEFLFCFDYLYAFYFFFHLILYFLFEILNKQVHYRPGFMPVIPIYGEDMATSGSTRSVRDEGK